MFFQEFGVRLREIRTLYVENNWGLFTWREEDPSARKILEGGSS